MCNRSIVTAEAQDIVLEAAKLMRQQHVGSLIIVSKNSGGVRPIGIVTDRDIVIEVLAEEVPLDSITLEDIMSRSPILAREDDDLWETISRMREKGIRRVPVVDSIGLLVGIFTVDDMIEIISEELSNMVSLISREQIQEVKRRSDH